MCLMLRDSREAEEEEEEEEEEGNSCKPHIMRPFVRPRPSVRTPEPLRFLRADVITLVRGRTDGRRTKRGEGERGE